MKIGVICSEHQDMPLKEVILRVPANTFDIKRVELIPGKKNDDRLPKVMELTSSIQVINNREMVKRLQRLYGGLRK